MLISRLKALTRIILETDTGSLYQLTVMEPEISVVQLSCYDPACRIDPPQTCQVLGAEVGKKIAPGIEQYRRLVVRCSDVDYVFGPIVGATVCGAGWTYDLWGQQ